MFDDVDSLHVKRNHLVGCSYLVIIDATILCCINRPMMGLQKPA
jgi:hypothetical protein